MLTSVQRTEESLRKFKKIRDPLNADQKVNTDDDKIRKQLQIDVQCYIEAVKTRLTIESYERDTKYDISLFPSFVGKKLNQLE